uniref:Secreted protein n=1 Tax=Steinernema glaseri TaxID=37863 RepID=A0A1I8A2R3_9BILA
MNHTMEVIMALLMELIMHLITDLIMDFLKGLLLIMDFLKRFLKRRHMDYINKTNGFLHTLLGSRVLRTMCVLPMFELCFGHASDAPWLEMLRSVMS